MATPEQPAGDAEQVWSEPQHAIAYREARAVLNAQQQRKNNLDDKALRTTRLATVVVGALITALETLSIDIVGVAGVVGVGLLTISFGAGLATYSGSGPSLGPSGGDLRRLVRGKDEEWEQQFLEQMSGWIELGASRLDRSAVLLIVSETTLFAGVLVTLFAILL